jgi:hypothetical protein
MTKARDGRLVRAERRYGLRKVGAVALLVVVAVVAGLILLFRSPPNPYSRYPIESTSGSAGCFVTVSDSIPVRPDVIGLNPASRESHIMNDLRDEYYLRVARDGLSEADRWAQDQAQKYC